MTYQSRVEPNPVLTIQEIRQMLLQFFTYLSIWCGHFRALKQL